MIDVKRPKSEEAKNDELNGVETDPILDKIAKSRGVDLQKLLKTLKRHPDDLTEAEQTDIINFSSAVLPKTMERKMIEMYRKNRDKLNELLFNHNTRMATRLATIYNAKYARTAINKRYIKEDFLSAARYGLWMGATRFDIDRTYKGQPIKFITFATPWVFRYIGEMLYEKENMIVHQSLDASPYSDSDTTLGDSISEDDIMPGFTGEGEDGEGEEETDVNPMMLVGEDEENFDIREQVGDETLLQSLDEGRLETIVGPGEDMEELSDDELKRRVDDYMNAINSISSKKRKMMEEIAPEAFEETPTEEAAEPQPEGQSEEEKEADLEPPAIDEKSLKAVEYLCNTIFSMKDPQERAITLFVARKYIRKTVKALKGKECPECILNANNKLKGVPGNKKLLLECLKMSKEEFAKLCNHYAMKHINRNI